VIEGGIGLELNGVRAGYGQGDVLRGLDLEVPTGQITCLIGPNGSGKSTVLRVVSGLLRPREGMVLHDGDNVTGASPREMLRRGVAQVPQERSLFPAMSVWDNLLLGAHINPDKEAVRSRADEIAERFPLIDKRRGDLAGSLSGGEQKTVEIARALMLDPQVLCFDEPSIGLEPRIRKSVFDAIAGLNREGCTILLVEQNARSGLSIAHHGAVLHSGTVQLRAPAHELLDNAEVARLYLGAS
jgi:branched-chain amino acid transport system ATP-binding protein